LLNFLRDIVLHPLHGNGYQWWSGLGSGSAWLAGIALFWRKHNCHVGGCWRLSWHEHPDHGHPVCRKHFPGEVGA